MDPISAVLGVVGTVISRIWPDKSEQEKADLALALQKELNAANLLTKQLDVNAVEAGNPSVFVSGWRPGIGWGLGSVVVFYAFFTVVTSVMVAWGYHVVSMPPMDPMVRDIVLGLLGLSGITRTVEKINGVARR